MTDNELISTIAKIRRLEEYKATMTEEIEYLKGKITEHMRTEELSKLRVGKYNVSYSEYTQNRFDSVKFKAEHSDLYAQYTKTTQATRLTISLTKK